MSLGGAIRSVAVVTVSCFWAVLVCIQILRLLITKGKKILQKKNRTSSPACVNDEVYGTHKYVHLPDRDMKLHYVESGDENAPVMLMMHGFPEFWYSWRHQIRHFNKSHRVIAIDLPGYGGSSKPTNVARYTVEELVKDVEAFLAKLDINSCIVLGHDWGGALTWGLLAQYPHRVEKAVVMNCPHPQAFMKLIQGSWAQFMKSWYMFFFNVPYISEWFFSSGDLKMMENALVGKKMGVQSGAMKPEDVEAFKWAFNSMWDFTGPMNYIRATLRGYNTRSLASVGKIGSDNPVLMIWGTHDGALTKKTAELTREFVEDFQLEFIEGASHWVQQDEPDQVNRLVVQFLE